MAIGFQQNSPATTSPPELRWRKTFRRHFHGPIAEGTKSFAFLMIDLDGARRRRRPLGGYGIPGFVTGSPKARLQNRNEKYVGGQSTFKLANYNGTCTPPGPPHHYAFSVMATDLEPAGFEGGHDARGTRQGAGRPRQGHHQSDRHFSKP